MADAGRHQGLHQFVDLDLGADIDADGRLVEQEHRNVAGQSARQQDLLPVAAGKLGDRALDLGRAQLQFVDDPLHDAPLARRAARCGASRKPASRAPPSRHSRAPAAPAPGLRRRGPRESSRRPRFIIVAGSGAAMILAAARGSLPDAIASSPTIARMISDLPQPTRPAMPVISPARA